jgi:hypothetical protein
MLMVVFMLLGPLAPGAPDPRAPLEAEFDETSGILRAPGRGAGGHRDGG